MTLLFQREIFITYTVSTSYFLLTIVSSLVALSILPLPFTPVKANPLTCSVRFYKSSFDNKLKSVCDDSSLMLFVLQYTQG